MSVKNIHGFKADLDFGEAEFVMPKWMAKEIPFTRMDLLSDLISDISEYYLQACTENFMELTSKNYRPGKCFDLWFKKYINKMDEMGLQIPQEAEAPCKRAFYLQYPLNVQTNDVVH